MRFAFMDEGGISQHEPKTFVVGVFVHADTQLIPLEEELEAVKRKHIPEKDWDTFVFHAKELWGGGKYFKDKSVWPIEKRGAILDDLAAIPAKLNIPIVYAWTERADVKARHKGADEMTEHDFSVACHSIAFMGCMLRIEEFMRRIWPDEVAQMVAEDNDSARQTIKGVMALFRSESYINEVKEKHPGVLPLQRIRGPIHFAQKTESAPLQLADLCAFLIRRRFFKHDDISVRFYDKIKSMMLLRPAQDAPPELQKIPIKANFLRPWRVRV